MLIGLAYAASDEIHQYFVPGRSSDAGDWLADALGVGAGCLLVYRVLSGRLRYRETIVEGFERMPEALVGLFKGSNLGKQVVRVSAP